MKIIIKMLLWGITLVGLGYTGFHLTHPSLVFKLDEATLSTMTDATIHALKVQQFDTLGQLTHTLYSPLAHHIPFNDTYRLTTPHIMVTARHAPWTIRAKHAIAMHHGETVTLDHQVVIHQDQSTSHEESTLTTESITYLPREKLAFSRDLVTYMQGKNKVESIGMNAFLEAKRIQLLSQAKGSYEPSHS